MSFTLEVEGRAMLEYLEMKSCTSNSDCPSSKNCANLLAGETDPVGAALGKPIKASSNDRCANHRTAEATAMAQAVITGNSIPGSVAAYPSNFCMKDPQSWGTPSSSDTSTGTISTVDWNKVMKQVEEWAKDSKASVKSDVLTVSLCLVICFIRLQIGTISMIVRHLKSRSMQISQLKEDRSEFVFANPTVATSAPTGAPTDASTFQPTLSPSLTPTMSPSNAGDPPGPSSEPTAIPTANPTGLPTNVPTANPTVRASVLAYAHACAFACVWVQVCADKCACAHTPARMCTGCEGVQHSHSFLPSYTCPN